MVSGMMVLKAELKSMKITLAWWWWGLVGVWRVWLCHKACKDAAELLR